MIDLSNSFIGSSVQADARRGYPARTVRLVLGEQRIWSNGQYQEAEQTVHRMSASTARGLARALVAEARIIEAAVKGKR